MTLDKGLRFWTDFAGPNDEGEHVSVVGVGYGSAITPEEGEHVTLFDSEGHICDAVVAATFEHAGFVVVHSRAEIATWRETLPVVLTGAVADEVPATS